MYVFNGGSAEEKRRRCSCESQFNTSTPGSWQPFYTSPILFTLIVLACIDHTIQDGVLRCNIYHAYTTTIEPVYKCNVRLDTLTLTAFYPDVCKDLLNNF